MRYTLMYWWFRAQWIFAAVLFTFLLTYGWDSWGTQFAIGVMLGCFGYQCAHYLTYGKWFE